jgi:hypothetical protein
MSFTIPSLFGAPVPSNAQGQPISAFGNGLASQAFGNGLPLQVNGAGVNLPLWQTPLASAKITGLTNPMSNVTVTSLPAGQSVNITPAVSQMSPRRRLALAEQQAMAAPAPTTQRQMSPRAMQLLQQPSNITLPATPGSNLPPKTTQGFVSLIPPKSVEPMTAGSRQMSPRAVPLSTLMAEASMGAAPRQMSPRALAAQSNGVPMMTAGTRQLSPRALAAQSTQAPMMTAGTRQLSPRALAAQSNGVPMMTAGTRQLSPRAFAGQPATSRSLLYPNLATMSSNYQELLAKNSKMADLVKNGYHPVSTVIVKNNEGGLEGRYVKALNKMGQHVFVLLDTQGYTAVDPKDLTMIEAKAASIVPLGVKASGLDNAGAEVSGVAFECNEGVCTLIRGQDTTPRETSFVYVEKKAEKAAIIQDHVIAYPIVRLSEIIANPELVMKNVDLATRRIRNAAYQNVLWKTKKEGEYIAALNAAFARFTSVCGESFAQLNKDINMLEGFNAQAMQIKSLSTLEQAKHEKVMNNLAYRNEMVPKILMKCEEVAAAKEELAAITARINSVTDQLVAMSRATRGVIDG